MKLFQLTDRFVKMVQAGLGEMEVGISVDYMEGGTTRVLRFSRELLPTVRTQEKILLLHGQRSIPLKIGEVDPATVKLKLEPGFEKRIKEQRLKLEAKKIVAEQTALKGLIPSLNTPAIAPLPPLSASDLIKWVGPTAKPKPKKPKKGKK